MQRLSDLYSIKNVLFLLFCGCLALVPVALQHMRSRQASSSSKPPAAAASGGAAGSGAEHEL